MLGGLGLWFVLALTVSEQADYMYFGGFVTVSLVSVCAVVGAAKSRVRWFDPAPIQWLGTRSYGIYLWHWPVLVALTPERAGLHGVSLALVRCGVTGLATEISYRWIEQPVRLRRRGPLTISRLVLPVGLAASFAAAIIGLALPQAASTLIDFEAAERVDFPASTLITQAGDTSVLPLRVGVFGDSTALMLSYGVGADEPRISTRRGSTHLGCPIGRGGETRGNGIDGDQPEKSGVAVRTVCDWTSTWPSTAELQQLDIAVVLVGLWDIAGRKVPDLGERWETIDDPEYRDWLATEIGAAADSLHIVGGVEHVVWLTLPNKAGSSAGNRVQAFNKLVEQESATRLWLTVADFATFIRDTGRDKELRPDGIHLTKDSAREVARDWLNGVLIAVAASQ